MIGGATTRCAPIPPSESETIMADASTHEFPDPDVDYRKHPELYRLGRGERGVLTVQPYKDEILPHWRFKTPEIAQESADTIYKMYRDYRDEEDFVGMDMARKFLQMGYTRSRRYANHKSGQKYDPDTGEQLPREPDEEKAESARIFKEKWDAVTDDDVYQKLKKRHQESIGHA